MGLALWLRLKSLPNYPIIDDELGTFSALKGIVTTGLPRLDENGLLYWRALLPHYLMALPLFFTDATVQAARIVPTLFSVLILPVAYAGGRMLSGRFAAWLLVGFWLFQTIKITMPLLRVSIFRSNSFFLLRRCWAEAILYWVDRSMEHGYWQPL